MVRHSVDLDLLDAITIKLEAFEDFFDEQLQALDRSVQKLHDSWQGDAAAAQKQAHDKLMAAAREIHTAIKDFREAAENAHHNYTTAVRSNVRMWRGGNP